MLVSFLLYLPETNFNISFTFLSIQTCTHVSCVRIGRLSQPASHVAENILGGVKCIATKVPQGFRNYQSLHLKTVASIALPIYNSLPPQPTRLPEVGEEEESAPVVKKIKLDEGSEGVSDSEAEEVDEEEMAAQEEEQEEDEISPKETVKKSSKRLKVSDYVDTTLKRSSLTPLTTKIRGGVKRKVSRKSRDGAQVRTLSAKKIKGSTVISSKFEKAERKRRRRTLN